MQLAGVVVDTADRQTVQCTVEVVQHLMVVGGLGQGLASAVVVVVVVVEATKWISRNTISVMYH